MASGRKSAAKDLPSDTNKEGLCGWLYFNCGTGIVPKLRLRWFIYSDHSKQIEYFLNPKDLSRQGAISIETAAFSPAAVRDSHGFYYLDIVTNDRMHRIYHEDWPVINHWKNGLQERRGRIQGVLINQGTELVDRIKNEVKRDGAKFDEGNNRWGEAQNPSSIDMNPVVEDYSDPLILNSFERMTVTTSPGQIEQIITAQLPNLEAIQNGLSAEPAHKDCDTCDRLRCKYADVAEKLRMMERQIGSYREMLECHEHAWRDVIDAVEPEKKEKKTFAGALLSFVPIPLSPSLSPQKSRSKDNPAQEKPLTTTVKRTNELNRIKKERAAFIRQNAILQAELVNLRRYWAASVHHEHYLIVALDKVSNLYRQQRDIMFNKNSNTSMLVQLNEGNEQFDQVYRTAIRETDIYGFFLHYGIPDQLAIFKQLEEVSNGFEYLREPDTTAGDAQQQSKWDEYMVKYANVPITKTPELKTLLRNGVPSVYRGKIWEKLTLFYVQQYRSQHEENYYENLVDRITNNAASSNNPEAKQIELDLQRSLPENVHFESPDRTGPADYRSGRKLMSLRNVLLCFASEHNDTIGYCQGMDRLAAVLLLNLSEEMAFWSLTVIVRRLRPPEYYTPSLKDAKADQRVLQDLIQEQLPSVHERLRLFDVDISLFSFKWFLTMFVDGFSWKVYMKIWDAFLYEGDKVIFRYAVATMVYLEPLILYQQDGGGVMRVLRSAGSLIKDHYRLTHIAFHDLRQFPKRRISQKRSTYRDKIDHEMDELNQHRINLQVRSKIIDQKNNTKDSLSTPDSDG